MSDFYDSLDDDKDENKASPRSLDRRKAVSSDSIKLSCEYDSTEKYSFFLNEKINREKSDQLHLFPFSEESPNKLILPKIIQNGPVPVPKIIVDKKQLLEQGLQFNSDGSFTKSPREEKEELPFITREYRNLQFQKKKTYAPSNKIPAVKSRKKNSLILPNAVENQINISQLVNANKKRDSREDLPVSDSSAFSKRSQTKTRIISRSTSKDSYNLTDSMKEKLLQTNTGKLHNEKKEREHVTKPKKEIKVLDKNKNSTTKRKTEAWKPLNLSSKENFHLDELVRNEKKSRNVPQKISKYKSDILLNCIKPKLNYCERRQLENGFNPFFLRQEFKKVPDDTTRSNFGDSQLGDLPEVSSRIHTCDRLGNEEEEKFYRDLMERDKTLKQIQTSSRSDSPATVLRMGQNSLKDNYAVSGRSNFKCKPTFIDLQTEGNHSVVNPCRKCSHYCSSDSSPNMSKVELALKARTYGYLANARNIFKLKAQSERKFCATERDRTLKITGNMSTSSKDSIASIPSGKLIKQNSLPVSGFPTVRKQFPGKSQNFPRVTASLDKTNQLKTSNGSQKGFVFPQVSDMELKSGKRDITLFERINSCLAIPKP